MDEAVLFAFTDVDEGRIDTGQDVFDPAEIDITDLVTAWATTSSSTRFVVEHCSDAQLPPQ